ncbi:PEGA domain-containing protein [Saccharicrinis sp. FJH62]|uniref:PEGA domain-containing protein n=1 Tax=Saccharicrinis sp. FJH62 TaxID=3344657 RepID=UPI0035D47C98
MKKHTPQFRLTAFLLAVTVLFSGCVSSTVIRTIPEGAKLYMNDEIVGTTPYKHSDSKILMSETQIRIEKEGYEPFFTTLTKDEEIDPGAIVGGIFLTFPFIWALRYKPVHTYELIPLWPEESIIENLEQKDIQLTEPNDSVPVQNPAVKIVK